MVLVHSETRTWWFIILYIHFWKSTACFFSTRLGSISNYFKVVIHCWEISSGHELMWFKWYSLNIQKNLQYQHDEPLSKRGTRRTFYCHVRSFTKEDFEWGLKMLTPALEILEYKQDIMA